MIKLNLSNEEARYLYRLLGKIYWEHTEDYILYGLWNQLRNHTEKITGRGEEDEDSGSVSR